MWKKGIYRAKDHHSQSIKILYTSTEGCIVLASVSKSDFSIEPECEFFFFYICVSLCWYRWWYIY